MSGIIGSRFNNRGSGLVGSLGTDGQVFTSSGAGAGAVYEDSGGGGKILQIVQNVKTDTASYSGSAWQSITGFSKAITPIAAGSSFIVQWEITLGYGRVFSNLHLDIDGAGYNSLTDYVGAAAGSRARTNAMYDDADSTNISTSTVLDTPTYSLTDVLTYDVRFLTHSAHTGYVNRTGADADNYYTARGASFITITEIAA